ncbi:MAG: helix-turn-helix transcriptional regulator [Bacteroidia bacterium]|nr:helix-turn-helix transcriptional regulator [Bacteroidia bacterium]
MQKNISENIRSLRAAYDLSIKSFSAKCGISDVALFNIEKGKTKSLHSSTLQKIIQTFNTTEKWLTKGEEPMLPNGLVRFENKIINTVNVFNNENNFELKIKNDMLEKQNERLWTIIEKITLDTKTATI